MTDHRQIIQDQIMTVYDPEFPLIDIWTMGLIYDIQRSDDLERIQITMTYTTPACPSGEEMQEMMISAIQDAYPDATITIELTFEPMWTIDHMKDPDLKRMFE